MELKQNFFFYKIYEEQLIYLFLFLKTYKKLYQYLLSLVPKTLLFFFLKIFQFCNPQTAMRMVDYSDAYSAYLPCRIAMVQDKQGKYYLYSLDMDIMLHGGKTLPPELFVEAKKVQAIITDIMQRGAAGDF